MGEANEIMEFRADLKEGKVVASYFLRQTTDAFLRKPSSSSLVLVIVVHPSGIVGGCVHAIHGIRVRTIHHQSQLLRRAQCSPHGWI